MAILGHPHCMVKAILGESIINADVVLGNFSCLLDPYPTNYY
jgi:hypothetical protein